MLVTLFALVASLPQVKTGLDFTGNSTPSIWFSDMNITVSVVLFWIFIAICVAFVIHAIIGIATKQYKKMDGEAEAEQVMLKIRDIELKVDTKLSKIMAKLGIENDEQERTTKEKDKPRA